jgi:two-component system, chemotaxis family, sensor kinase CheA
MDPDILKELLGEFIVETSESLNILEKDLLGCESAAIDRDTLNRIFRTVHTIKGSGGSLALSTMESLSHEAEQLLDNVRDGHLTLKPADVTLLLELVDALRRILVNLQQNANEGTENYSHLRDRLRQAWEAPTAAAPAARVSKKQPTPRTSAKHPVRGNTGCTPARCRNHRAVCLCW